MSVQAVYAALTAGKLGGLGLDVYWTEPEDPNKSLYQQKNVICFPHTGPSTTGVLRMSAEFVADNIIRMKEGKELVGKL